MNNSPMLKCRRIGCGQTRAAPQGSGSARLRLRTAPAQQGSGSATLILCILCKMLTYLHEFSLNVNELCVQMSPKYWSYTRPTKMINLLQSLRKTIKFYLQYSCSILITLRHIKSMVSLIVQRRNI